MFPYQEKLKHGIERTTKGPVNTASTLYTVPTTIQPITLVNTVLSVIGPLTRETFSMKV